MTTGAVPGHLRLGLHALSELSGRLLKGGKRHPAPLRQQAQMRIAAERSFYAIVGAHQTNLAGCHLWGEDQAVLAARPPGQDHLSPGMARQMTTDKETRLERRSDRRLLVMPRVVTTQTRGRWEEVLLVGIDWADKEHVYC